MQAVRGRKWAGVVGLGVVGAAVAGAGLLRARKARPAGGYRYHSGYQEEIVLRDGTRVRLRLVRPGDKRMLSRAIQTASPQTRYMRFHTLKPAFTRGELRYLTEVDGINHFAMGSVLRRNRRQGVGIGRFVRLAADPKAADVAIAVRDDLQHEGLGSALLVRLMEAAKERGIERLQCQVLATNAAALRLLRRVCPNVTLRNEGTVVFAEIAL